MSLYARGTIVGPYRPVRADSQPDLLSLHEFGIEAAGKPGPVTFQLAELVLKEQARLPQPVGIVGTVVADVALREVSGGSIGIAPEHLVVGESSNMVGGGLGTWGEVQKVRQVMDEEELTLPMIFGQARHVGRIGLQFQRAGISEFIIPFGLPRSWSPRSDQAWTRHPFLWGVHELLGVPVLRKQNKI